MNTLLQDIRFCGAPAADRVMDFGLQANGTTHSVWGYEVSGQNFEVLAIKPLLGRMHELGIRVALGAQARQIVSTALGRMVVLLAGGSVIGLLLGVAASRLLAAVVYQASAQDPFVLASVALTMMLTGLLSIVGPVRRALHVDPANLLREQ